MAWLYHLMQPRSSIRVLGAASIFSQRSMQQPPSSHADVEVEALSLYSCWCLGLLCQTLALTVFALDFQAWFHNREGSQL